MKSIAVLILLLVSMSSWAELKLGNYEGQTASGEQCWIKIETIDFLGGVRSPANERVTVKTSFKMNKSFLLSHVVGTDDEGLPIVDKGILHQVVKLESMVTGVVMQMVHSASYHGPVQFVYFVDPLYENNLQEYKCFNLKFEQ